MDPTKIKRNTAAHALWTAFDHAATQDDPVPPLTELEEVLDAIADYCTAKMIDQLTHIAGAMIAKHAAPTDEQNQTGSSPQP